MIDVPRERTRAPFVVRDVHSAQLGRAVLAAVLAALLTACGAAGGGNDGEFVTRTGIVVTGVVDDGTPTSPVAGGTCRVVDLAGNILDTATTEADGSYLVLLDPGRQAFVSCTASGQGLLALRTFVSTNGLPEGGELGGQDVLPSTTVFARIVAAESADDPTLDVGERIAELRGLIVPLDSTQVPADADLQLLADAATIAYDAMRDAGDDVDFDAFLTDLFEDGGVDFFPTVSSAGAIEAAIAERVGAAGRSLADAVLATHPDFEFALFNVGGARSELGDVARFATILADARSAAGELPQLTLSGGDTLRSGVSLVAGLETQDPFFDALAVDALDVDAVVVGAEDLELGPPVYGIFLDRLAGASFAVITDIDPVLEPNAFVPNAVASTAQILLLDRASRRIGIIGATPENLPDITSTRSLITFTGTGRIGRLQAGIDNLRAAGARIILLLTSERSEADVGALVAELQGVDLAVTLPGVPAVATDFGGEGPQPTTLTSVTDSDGRNVPLVPGVGAYGGLVDVTVRVDPLGELFAAATTAQVRRVAGAGEEQPTAEDAEVVSSISEPLATAIDAVRTASAGQNEVVLDPRPETLFVDDTNWGALVADAVLSTARSQAPSYQSFSPIISIVDAGSIDSATEIAAGDRTRGEYFDFVDRSQVITVLQQVTPAQVERLLEFAFAGSGTGQFAQYGGLIVTHDPNGTAQVLDVDGSVLVEGTRVVDARIGDTFIVQDGAFVDGGPTISIAISEQVRDSYPLTGIDVINVGVTVAQAVDAFVRVTLGGNVSDEAFPVGGLGRIEVDDGT